MSLEQFIQELTILTDKHKIVIDGCGCCGSPFLKVVETGKAALWEDNLKRYEGQLVENRY